MIGCAYSQCYDPQSGAVARKPELNIYQIPNLANAAPHAHQCFSYCTRRTVEVVEL